MTLHKSRLTRDEIRYDFPPDQIPELRTAEIHSAVIGQDRAVSALELGLGIHSAGYNIFIMGASGTGRRTLLDSLLQNYKPNTANLQDIAYAWNFLRPNEPRALCFPAGQGGYFKKNLQTAIESIRRQILLISKSEVFATAKKKIVTVADMTENQLLAEFEQSMATEGFKLLQIKDDDSPSTDLLPLFRGKPVSFEELQELAVRQKISPSRVQELRERYYANLDRLTELFDTLREKRRHTEKQLRALKAESALPIIENELSVLKKLCEKDSMNPCVLSWLHELQEDLLARIHQYSEPFKSSAHKRHFFVRYSINLMCEHSADRSYIIREEVPTFSNLFGSIAPTSPTGGPPHPNHARLRPGAVHRATGGILILRLQDLMNEEGSWSYLKRVLQTGKIEIQNPPVGNFSPSLIKPEVLPVHLKVIIIGGEHSYDFLYREDPDFQKLFKVCAEFDSVMPRTHENMAKLVRFAEEFSAKNSLLTVDDSALAALITRASRISEYRTMLTTCFTQISDLLTEADYQARAKGEDSISAKHVTEALERRRHFQRLPEEKFTEMIRSRELIVDVDGMKTGRVNGLSIHDRGYQAFGIPVAVTAQAAPGNKGIINVERESGLSGEIYDKAHLIIQGMLHRNFAWDLPLAVSASICFEQSYSPVDGDSASCAELFALLSAIAGVPLRQDIAVTGSVNQLGDVQPVGGIPEKIEGFFEACTILGMSGHQGVMIPRRNKHNVLLSPKIEEAVAVGQFHIWAIDTVLEGLEILSGLPPDQFADRVRETLTRYAEQMQRQQ